MLACTLSLTAFMSTWTLSTFTPYLLAVRGSLLMYVQMAQHLYQISAGTQEVTREWKAPTF
eukprot:2625659-Ditylum_brightwellii.AAC.1